MISLKIYGKVNKTYAMLVPIYRGFSSFYRDKPMKRKKGFFSISAVAEMFSVHQQTIRLYEKEGLISPKRSDGNTRLFSEEDVNKLEEIIYLTHQLGINLAGVEMILKLQKKIERLQKQMNTAFDDVQSDLNKEGLASKEQAQLHAQRLAEVKKYPTKHPVLSSFPNQDHKPQPKLADVIQWKVDYDE